MHPPARHRRIRRGVTGTANATAAALASPTRATDGRAPRLALPVQRLGHIHARPPPSAAGLHNDTLAAAHLRAAGGASAALKRGERARGYWQELGSALARLGRTEEMRAAFHEAAETHAVWVSARPRSFGAPRARGQEAIWKGVGTIPGAS